MYRLYNLVRFLVLRKRNKSNVNKRVWIKYIKFIKLICYIKWSRLGSRVSIRGNVKFLRLYVGSDRVYISALLVHPLRLMLIFKL